MRYHVDGWRDEAGFAGEAGASLSLGGGLGGGLTIGPGGVVTTGAVDVGFSKAWDLLSDEQKLAYGKLSGQVKSAIQTGTKLYGTIAPAVAFAQTIAQGGSVDPQMVVAALTGVVTLCAGPIVGGLFGAMAELGLGFEALVIEFVRALGFFPEVKQYTFIGYVRKGVDTIPYGPDDPNWFHVETREDLMKLRWNGLAGHPSLVNEKGWDTNMFDLFDRTMAALQTPQEQCAHYSGAWQNGVWRPGKCDPQWLTVSQSANTFDRYFALMLKRNMQLWINAQGALKPRDVLRNAAIVWNAVHAGSCNAEASGCPNASDTMCYRPAERPYKYATGIVSAVLGFAGDYPDYIGNAQPLCINIGPGLDLSGVIAKTPSPTSAPDAFIVPPSAYGGLAKKNRAKVVPASTAPAPRPVMVLRGVRQVKSSQDLAGAKAAGATAHLTGVTPTHIAVGGLAAVALLKPALFAKLLAGFGL